MFFLKNISQIAFDCLWSPKWCVELTVYQGQLHLVTFWGVTECKLCMPHVCINSWARCAVEKAPTGSQLLTMLYFFFWIKEKLQLLKLNLEVKNVPKNGNLDLSIYKDWNGKLWLKNFGSTYLCNRLSHRWLGEGEGGLQGGYAGVSIKIPILVLPVLLCWWWMMMSDDNDGGAVRTLQLWHASLQMNKWWWVVLMPHSLLGWGEGVITSYVSFMGHGVGPLSFPFGSPTRATQVHFTQQ